MATLKTIEVVLSVATALLGTDAAIVKLAKSIEKLDKYFQKA